MRRNSRCQQVTKLQTFEPWLLVVRNIHWVAEYVMTICSTFLLNHPKDDFAVRMFSKSVAIATARLTNEIAKHINRVRPSFSIITQLPQKDDIVNNDRIKNWEVLQRNSVSDSFCLGIGAEKPRKSSEQQVAVTCQYVDVRIINKFYNLSEIQMSKLAVI